MKKLITIASLILITVLAVGCSKDDDSISSSSKDLVGTWKLDYFVQDGQLTEEIICDNQIQYVFSSNGNYTETTYAGSSSKDCKTATVTSGTWTNISDNDYELTPNKTSSTSTSLNITFHDDFTKFTSEVSSTRTEGFEKI
ncbi:lipocalin family protein [Polaribacter sp. Z014]|uniref:lipocalin family protein n=1 Tax=Polaribacter sp. Z014 TaxID=2927126 RepID=UPI0020210BFA|nr:lipocalin family protein [Polaribacter sp. Z014]MCL7763660.1 lipocalin family protein [Polaribacter sp. Z014]